MKKLAVGTPVWFVTPDEIRRTGEVARYRGSDTVVAVDCGAFYMVPPEEIHRVRTASVGIAVFGHSPVTDGVLNERLREAVATAQKHPGAPILLAGTNEETELMAHRLGKVVDPDCFIIDPGSVNTKGNAAFISTAAKDAGIADIIVVTSDDHRERVAKELNRAAEPPTRRVVRADIRQLRDPSPLTGDDWSLSLGYSAGFGAPSEDDVLGWMAEEHPGWRVLDCTNGRPGWLKVVASASPTAADHSLIADPVNMARQMPVDRWKPGNNPGLMTPELGGGSGSGSPGGRFDIGAEAECDKDEDEDEDGAKTGRLRITAADLRLGHDVDMPTVYGAHGPAVGHQRTASQDDPQQYDIFQYIGSGQGYTQANAPQPGEDWQLWTPWGGRRQDSEIRRVSDGVKYHGKPGLTHPNAWKFLGPGVSSGPDTGQLLQAPAPATPSESPASAPKSEGDQLVDFFGGGGQWKTPEKHSWSARISWYSPPSAADVAAYLQTLSVSDGVGAVEVTGVSDAGSSGTIQILDVDGTYSVGGSQFWNKLTRADERRDAIQNLVYRELTAAASAQGIQGAGLPDSKVVEVSNVRRVARKTAAAYEQMYGPLGSHFDDSVGTGHGEDASSGSYYRNADADPEEAQREEDGESIETIGLGLNVARKTDDPARVRVGVDKTTKTYWTEYYPDIGGGEGYGELLVKNVKEDDADGDKDADFHKTAPPTEERREMVQAMFLDSFDRMPTFKERVACMLIYRRVDEWGAKTARLIKTAQEEEEEEGEPLTEEELQEAGVGGFGSKFMKGVGDVAKGIGSAAEGAAEKATEFGADVADTLKTTEGAQSGPASAAALVEAARKDPKLQKSLDKLVLKAIQAWAATPGELEQKLTQNVYRDILTPVINHHQRGWSSGDLRRVNKFLSSEQGMDRIQNWDSRQQRRRPGGGGGGGAPSAPARAPEPTTEEIETDFFGAPEPAPVSPPEAPVVAEEPTPEPAAAVEEEVAAVELGEGAQRFLDMMKRTPDGIDSAIGMMEEALQGDDKETKAKLKRLRDTIGGPATKAEAEEILRQLTSDDEPPPSDPEGGAPPPSRSEADAILGDPALRIPAHPEFLGIPPVRLPAGWTPEDSALGAQELEEDVLREELGMSEPAAPAPAAPSESAIEFQQTIEEGGGEPPADAPVAETPGEYTPAQLDDMFLALPDDVREGIEDQLGALSEEEYDALIVQRYQEQEGEAAAEPSGLPEDLTTSEPDPEDVISEPGFGVEPEPEPTPDPSDDYAWAEELTSEDLPGLGEVEDRPPSLYDDPDYAAASGNRSDLGMRLYKEEEVARDVRKKVRSLEHALSPREMAQTRADYAQQGKPKLAETSIQLSKGSLRDAQDQLAAAEETVAATKVLFDEAEVAFEVAQEKANEYVTQEELRATDPLAAQQQEVARLQEAYDQSGDDADAEFALETAQQALADMEDRVEAPADDLPVEEDIEMQQQELEQDELQPEQELREILDAPGAADRQNVPEIQDLAEEIAEAESQEILEGTDVVRSTPEDIEAKRLEVAELQKIVDANPSDNISEHGALWYAEEQLADMEAAMQGGGGEPVSEPPASDELEESLVEEQLAVPAGESAIPTDKIPGRKEELPIPELVVDPAPVSEGDTPTDPIGDRGKQRDQGSAPHIIDQEAYIQELKERALSGDAAVMGELGAAQDRLNEMRAQEAVVQSEADAILGQEPFAEEPPGMTSFLESQSQGEGGKWPSEAPMPDPYAQTDYAHAPEGQPVVAPALSVDTDPHTMLPSEAQNIEDQITEAVEQVMSEDDPLVATPPGENVGSETEVGPVKAMRRRAAEAGDRVVLPAGTPYYAHDAQRRKTTHYPNGSEMNIKLTLQDVRAGGAWGMDAGNVFGTGKNYIWIPSTAFNDLITFEEESRRPSRYTWSDLPHKESNMKKESSAFANVWRALKVASLERNGADIVATITWDSDSPVFADTKSTSMRQVLRTYLKGVSSHKEGRIGNLGFITRARFLDFDMDAGMAVMAFRSSVPVPVKPQVITVSDKDL